MVSEASEKDRWLGQALLNNGAFRGLGTWYQALGTDDSSGTVQTFFALNLTAIGKGAALALSADTLDALDAAVLIRCARITTASLSANAKSSGRVAGLRGIALDTIAARDTGVVSTDLGRVAALAVIDALIAVVDDALSALYVTYGALTARGGRTARILVGA